ncbi:MAG: CoA protein activase [Clostridia bacterium]|nr:CoA protein activase [Clostridia bacterium]
MKITFPHMGNVYMAAKGLMDYLEIDVIVPPLCSSETLEIGTKYSPELACLPLKINLGNYIQSIERGADTIMLTGSCGPCRFGYYGIVQQKILEDLGYDVDIIIFDPPRGNIMQLIRRANKIFGGKKIKKIVQGFKKAYEIICRADYLDKLSFEVRPREKVAGQTDRIYMDYRRRVMNAVGPDDILKEIDHAVNKLLLIDTDYSREMVRIGIVGEIYTIIEPFVNLFIEQKLGNLGVEVNRSMSISSWINNTFSRFIGVEKEQEINDAAKPYLDLCIGGHARQCIGNTVLYSQQGYDGVIQILPFTCMPEIVAQSILPTVERDCNIPIMSLVVDELTGEAGYMTRLEAFVDLIRRRKERRELEDGRAVSWS